MNNQLPPSKVVLNSLYATSLRDQGSTASFDLETGGVDLDGTATVCIVSVLSFTALNKIYNITDSSNTLQVAWYDTSTGYHVTTVSVSNGAYDIYSLVDALNTSFTNQYSTSSNIAQYTVTFNSITGLITITPTFSSQPATLYGFYVITNNYTGLLQKLGFDLTLSTSLLGKFNGFQDLVTSAHTSLSITATNLPDLYYPKMIYVCVDQIHTPNRVSLPNNKYGVVLCEFVNTAAFGDLLHSEPFNPFEYHIPNLKTNTLTVRIVDQDNNPINWNGGYWTLVLGLVYGTQSQEDPTLGRTFRPLLKRTIHDPLMTSYERAAKRMDNKIHHY
jgi:hypothetical protein